MLSNEILLLKIIDANGRISLLKERGLSHSQVAILMKNQEDLGNIVISEEGISLTSNGKNFLKDNISKIVPREKDQWILPQEHLYREPIDVNKIILPNRKKI